MNAVTLSVKAEKYMNCMQPVTVSIIKGREHAGWMNRYKWN